MIKKTFNFENKLYVITENAISNGRSNEEVVRTAIAGGAELIQLREKQRSNDKVKKEAIKLLKICREKNVLFVVNDYIDIALGIGADGVHLGQADMSINEARKICGDKLILGLSTHSMEQALKADKEDWNYISVGPIYQTRAKDYTVGTKLLKEVLLKVNKPVVAIGGINYDNINEVLRQGAKNIAVISAVVSADNVEKAAKELVDKIKRN